MAKPFTSFKVTLLAGFLVVALIGGWVVLSQTPTSSQTPTPEEKLAEKIQHYNAVKNQPPTMDPTAIAEKDARQQRQIAASHEEYARWLEDFKVSGVDLRSLVWKEMEAYTRPPVSTIDEAVREAKLIVSGTATHVDFSATGIGQPRAVVQFTVEEVLLGTADDTIEVTFTGGPMRDGRSGEPVIGYHAHSPLLLSGDKAVLILIPSSPAYPGLLFPQGYTGVNKIQDGLIRASKHRGENLATLPMAGPRKLYDGLPEAEFIALLKEVIARN
jgi:hypothetical protein